MIIDKRLNLDTELEYQKDGNLVFAQNVVLSSDGLAIQNEPAIVKFLTKVNFDMVGFIACNEEFVLFSSKSEIVRINKAGDVHECDTNWKYVGGEVFGTFTYNVNNELIIAVSERYLPDGVDCPLKVINLDRDNKIEGSDDNIYTLTPTIPKSNVIDIEYIIGNKIKKGKYNFFIKYYINDNFETTWFPIGIPIFVYDNIGSDVLKLIDDEYIQSTSEGTVDDNGEIPVYVEEYKIKYNDFYNEDSEYTNNNIKLKLEINETLNYTHFSIGYIINMNTGIEGRKTSKFHITTKEIIINNNSKPISVDELTINNFNIYNVNTMCNYKNRLYLANYKEENRNSIVDKIKTDSINIWYNNNTLDVHEITEGNYRVLRNQWKSKPGRAAIYNFFIHYVYPNGNYTDGIKIGTLDDYAGKLFFGIRTRINTDTTQTDEPIYYSPLKNTTTNDILDKINSSSITKNENTILIDYLTNNPDVYWWTIEAKFYEQYPNQYIENPVNSSRVKLRTIVNTKGEVLHVTPIDDTFNVDKLEFTNIKMYPEFVGYFISYEEPEYIQIGEGFVVSNDADLFEVETPALTSDWKFYYPEFNIVGGKTDVSRLVPTGLHSNKYGRVNLYMENDEDGFVSINHPNATGITYGKNNFAKREILSEDNPFYGFNINNSRIISPSSYENIGKEGYLYLESQFKVGTNTSEKPISFTAISKSRNLYLSDDKKLISLGYIKYVNYVNDQASNDYGREDVPYNYDFYRCFSSLIYFKSSGIIINQTNSNHINVATGNEYYPYRGSTINNPFYPHIGILKYWHETHYPLFLKEINQPAENIFYSYYSKIGMTEIVSDRADRIEIKNLVLNPRYVNDLYKLNPVYYDYTGKILVNYDKNLISNHMDNYVKTIRRSDVIQSESVINSWRYFRPENYKIITENKGTITNVVGIGNYLFAHCEHSLFLFDITDSLQALDKNVQLLQPDTFEVAYKEIFTSEQGYGGLQDFDSWICGEFGYVFYDSSSKHIYRFDGGKLINMNEGIDNFVKLYQPTYIFIGNDRTNNRLLFNFGFNKTIANKTIIDNVILSYSLITNNWLSTHSYTTADKFISIKDKIFIIDRNVTGSGENITNRDITIAEFDYINEKDNYSFNNYSMIPTTKILATKNDSSIIDVIFTANSYNKIKVLDFITYIINKDIYDDGFTNLQLEIYTNCCYSGIIDISQERKKVSEYKKPYYDYERWNFNWFRNVLDKFNNGEIVNRLTGKVIEYDQKVKRYYDNALMTGKYAVIRFTFKNINKPVFIKDIHAYFKP